MCCDRNLCGMRVAPADLSSGPSLLTVSSQQESLKPIYLPSTFINFKV